MISVFRICPRCDILTSRNKHKDRKCIRCSFVAWHWGWDDVSSSAWKDGFYDFTTSKYNVYVARGNLTSVSPLNKVRYKERAKVIPKRLHPKSNDDDVEKYLLLLG